jgi:cbb3-type cytochrome oxidase maturation protein
MSVMFVLIGFSLLVALGFLIAFLWSVKKGQYDDDYTPSVRILFDSSKTNLENNKENTIELNNQPNT